MHNVEHTSTQYSPQMLMRRISHCIIRYKISALTMKVMGRGLGIESWRHMYTFNQGDVRNKGFDQVLKVRLVLNARKSVDAVAD